MNVAFKSEFETIVDTVRAGDGVGEQSQIVEMW